jgi:hypothetical protein
MSDLYLRIHKDLHAFESGPGAKIHIFEIEAIPFIQPSKLAKNIRIHQPKHTSDPIRV